MLDLMKIKLENGVKEKISNIIPKGSTILRVDIEIEEEYSKNTKIIVQINDQILMNYDDHLPYEKGLWTLDRIKNVKEDGCIKVSVTSDNIDLFGSSTIYVVYNHETL